VDWNPQHHPRWPGDSPDGKGGQFRDADWNSWAARVVGQMGFPTGLEAAIASGVREEHQHFEGNSGSRITRPYFNEGTIGIRKTLAGAPYKGGRTAQEEADAEVLGAATARAFGVPAPEVVRTGPDEIVMTLIPSRPSGWARYKRNQGLTVSDLQGREQPARAHTAAEWRLAVFDLLTENHDRTNPTNLRLSDDGLSYTIDHSKLFDYELGRGPAIPGNLGAPGPYAGPFVTGFENPKWATNPLTRADIAWIQQRLDGLRGRFERDGRLEWWEAMNTRLAAIAKKARGTTDLLS